MSQLRKISVQNGSSQSNYESDHNAQKGEKSEACIVEGEQYGHVVSIELGGISDKDKRESLSDFHQHNESNDDKSCTKSKKKRSSSTSTPSDIAEEAETHYDSGFSTENEDSAAVSIDSNGSDEPVISEDNLLDAVMKSLDDGSRIEKRYLPDEYVNISSVSESSSLVSHRPKSYSGMASSNRACVDTFNYMEPIHVLAQNLIFPERYLPSIDGVVPSAAKGKWCAQNYKNLDSLVTRHRQIPEILMSPKLCGVMSIPLRDPIWLNGRDLPISARQMKALIEHKKINKLTNKRYDYTDIQSSETYSLEQQKKVKFYFNGFKLLDKEMFEELDYHLNQLFPLRLISSDFDGVKGRPLRDPVFINGIKKPLARKQTESLLRRHAPTKYFTQSDIIPYDELDEKQQSEIVFLRLGFQYFDKNMRMELDKHLGIEIPPELMSAFPHDKYSLKERYFIKRSSTPVSKKYFEEVIAKPDAAYSDGTSISREDIAKPAMYTQSQKRTCDFLDTGFTLLENKKRDDLYQLIKRRNSKQLLLQTKKELKSSAIAVTS